MLQHLPVSDHCCSRGGRLYGRQVSAVLWVTGVHQGKCMCRLCWSKFMDPQTPVVQQYYQLFLEPTAGNDVPITPQVNVSVRAQSAVATGLQLQVRALCFVHAACAGFVLGILD